MKRIFIAIITVAFSIGMANAQHHLLAQLSEQMETNSQLYREQFGRGEYKEAEATLIKLVELMDTTSIYKYPELNVSKGALNTQKGMYQYDLACVYAVDGNKKMALEALEQSVDNGYNGYDNMAWDKDLESLRKDKKFKQLLEIVKERRTISVLRKSNPYNFDDNTEVPKFEYQSTNSPLQLVRDYFQLDTIPGKDNELEHIKNLLHFVHDNIRHDGGSRTICEYTAIDIYNYAKATGKGVNCRMLAICLCDMYLSMGYKARVVTCLSADPNDYECHVINTVYSETLDKWLYIDPPMHAWVMDEEGTMLSIAEVRQRLIDDQPLVLCETANWNHENQQTKEYYLENYMAKNLYYFVCKSRSCFNQETIYRPYDNEDVRLIPVGFTNSNFQCPTTTNPDVFWAKPE